VGCGVPTGWGSAVNAAGVRPGDTVLVYGVGGIGINAVQAARHAGAQHVVAVDPVELKRDTALRLGATHTAATPEEAHRLSYELTRGVGAARVIVTVGTIDADVVGHAFDATGKAGTLVLTAMGGVADHTLSVSATMATLYKKTIRGSLFGDCNPTTDIPRLLELYRTGHLHLDELVTRTYRLEDIDQGYEDLLAGRIVRGVVVHDH
jgi:S-(hydroxymethyl)glutathione dehydrogenase/alcohol dehydrogenase